MNKLLILIALVLSVVAAGMAGYRWNQKRLDRETGARMMAGNGLRQMNQALLNYQFPSTTQPTSQPGH